MKPSRLSFTYTFAAIILVVVLLGEMSPNARVDAQRMYGRYDMYGNYRPPRWYRQFVRNNWGRVH